MLARMWRSRNSKTLLVGLQISATALENSVEDPQDWGLMHGYRMFIAAQFTIAKLWNQPRCPSTDEWIIKLWDMYTMEFYVAIKNKVTPFAWKWVELENIMLSEISQSQKVKSRMLSLICRSKGE